MAKIKLKPGQSVKGTCKGCGGDLIIEKHVKGFTSHHSIPMCQQYKDAVDATSEEAHERPNEGISIITWTEPD